MIRLAAIVSISLISAWLAVCAPLQADAKLAGKRQAKTSALVPDENWNRSVTGFGWPASAQEKLLETAMLESWRKCLPRHDAAVFAVVRLTAAQVPGQPPIISLGQSSDFPPVDEAALQTCRDVMTKEAQLLVKSLPAAGNSAYVALAFNPKGVPAKLLPVSQANALCSFETMQASIRGMKSLEPVDDWAARLCSVAALNINKTMQSRGGNTIFVPLDSAFVADVHASTARGLKVKVQRRSGTAFFDNCVSDGLNVVQNDQGVRLPRSGNVHGKITVSLLEAFKD
jgi:hypothetical protein